MAITAGEVPKPADRVNTTSSLIDGAGKGATRANRNINKTIEKKKAAREAKPKRPAIEDKKGRDGLRASDELCVDHVFVDEFQYFKNLETPTKMDRVAGIQSGGSERAFDMYMKRVTCMSGIPAIRPDRRHRHADQQQPVTRDVHLARYLDPEGLGEAAVSTIGIAWAATFGEVVDTMEISPDGKTLKPRSRFARFVNLPELQQMFRAFADVQTAEMLNLPRPRLETGKPIIVACPMSDEQHAIQDELVGLL